MCSRISLTGAESGGHLGPEGALRVYPNAHPKQTGMASKIAPTRRTVVPSLVPIAGFRDDLFVRSDPETKNVDAIQAFELVVGAESAKQAVYKLLSGLDGKGPSEGPLSETAMYLTPFKTVC